MLTPEQMGIVGRVIDHVALDCMSDMEGAPNTSRLLDEVERRCRRKGLVVTRAQIENIYHRSAGSPNYMAQEK
jgi:hypothetical protein